jgi:hypothetical protein
MKEILIPLNFTTTPVVYDTKQSFSASDEASGVLTFTTTADVAGTVASLTIRNASENANRQTVLIERLDINRSPFSYTFKNPLPFGQYEGTVLLKKNLTVIASAVFLFGVNSSLSAEVLPDLVKAYALDELVENVETEVSNLKDAYNLTVSETVKGVNKTESSLQAQENVRYLNEHQRKANELERIANENARIAAEVERKDTFDTLVDSEVIEQTVVQEVTEKYQEIEALNAPEMVSFRQQLADNELETNRINSILSTSADLFDPPIASNEWSTPTSDRVLDMSTDAFLNTFYDTHVGTHDNNYVVSKTSLGKDESGLYDIYEYDFCPAAYTKTILLTSGLHPYELPASFGLAHFIKHLMTKPFLHRGFENLYENVRIKVLPIMNPWGFDQNPKTYGNVTGVNINRNFDYNNAWANFPVYSANPLDPNYNEWNVKGDYPFSEAESVIIRDWGLLNSTADFWIDMHVGLWLGPWENFIYYQSNDPIVPEITKTLKYLEDRLRYKYGIENPTNEIRIDSPGSIRSKWMVEELGMSGMTIEQTPNNPLWGGEMNNEAGDITEFEVTIAAYVFQFLGLLQDGSFFVTETKKEIAKISTLETLLDMLIKTEPIIVQDTFTRPNGLLMDTYTETGALKWTQTVGDFRVVDGKVRDNLSGGSNTIYVDPGLLDYSLSADITWSKYVGLWFRYANISNAFLVRLNSTGLSTFKYVDSTTSIKLGEHLFTPIPSAAYNIKIKCKASYFEIYLDNIKVIEFHDTDLSHITKVGLRTSNDTVSTFDNFTVRLL